VSDYYTIREVDADGEGVTVAKFSEVSRDVQEIGDYLYVSFLYHIMKCSWESMVTTTPATNTSVYPTVYSTDTPSQDPAEELTITLTRAPTFIPSKDQNSITPTASPSEENVLDKFFFPVWLFSVWLIFFIFCLHCVYIMS